MCHHGEFAAAPHTVMTFSARRGLRRGPRAFGFGVAHRRLRRRRGPLAQPTSLTVSDLPTRPSVPPAPTMDTEAPRPTPAPTSRHRTAAPDQTPDGTWTGRGRTAIGQSIRGIHARSPGHTGRSPRKASTTGTQRSRIHRGRICWPTDTAPDVSLVVVQGTNRRGVHGLVGECGGASPGRSKVELVHTSSRGTTEREGDPLLG